MTEDLELHVGLSGEKAFAASVAQMTAAVARMEATIAKMPQATTPAAKGIDSVGNAAKSSGSMLTSFGGIASALAAGAVGMLANRSIDLAKAYEITSLQLEVFTGSAQAAKQTLDQFNKIADATPFENYEVESVGKKLLAFGIGLGEVEAKILEVGNASAQSGKPLEELGVLYGKAKVAGTLFAEDINQFIEAGVPIIEALAKQMGVTADKVKKLGSEGKITFPVFEAAFSSLYGTGGKFGGMMDKLATSSEGLMSTMRGDFNKAMREAGQQILPLVVESMKKLLPLAKAAVGIFGDVAKSALQMGLFLADNSAILIAGAGAYLAYSSAAISARVATLAASAATAISTAYTTAAISVQAAYITVTNALTGTITLATAAQRIMNLVMASNPLGLVIVGVTALVAAYVALSGSTKELTKEQAYHADLSKQVADGFGKESAGAAILFAKLKTLNPLSAEAKTIRDEINTTYATYLPNQLTETTNLEGIAKAQDAVNAALLTKIRLQVKEQELTRAITIQQTAVIEAYNSVGKATGASAAAIQKAISSVQTTLAKGSEDQRIATLRASGDFDALARELGKVSGVGADVQKTINDIAEAGLGLEFLDAAGAVSITEDSIKSLLAFMDEVPASATKAGKAIGNGANGTGGQAIAAAGSIDALNAELSKLKAAFEATGDAKTRLSIGQDIAELESTIERVTAQGAPLDTLVMKTNSITDSLVNMAAASDMGMRSLDQFAKDAAASFTSAEPVILTFSEKMQSALGEGAWSSIKSGLQNVKSAFMDFGASAAQSIGYAIGAGESLADAFRQSLNALLVEVPKLVGMALLNAAAAGPPSPASLPMAAAGLALLGLSGILKGVQDKNANERKMAIEGIPASASGGGAPGGASGGFAGLATATQQQQPININLVAELDGVALGGLFRQINRDYDRMTIKNG
jgi:tape measure domain-containing protein